MEEAVILHRRQDLLLRRAEDVNLDITSHGAVNPAQSESPANDPRLESNLRFRGEQL